MKTTRIALLALPVLSLTLVSGYSQAEGLAPSSSAAFAKQQVKNIEAASQYPGDVAEREGRAVVEQARSSSEDNKRWSHVVMQSDAAAEEADTLVMSLVRAIKFDMQLQPNDGHIIFTMPGTRHVFKLANSAGSRGDICPSYSVRVLEASNGHVVFRKVCKLFEYLRNRVYMSNEFYLYDVHPVLVYPVHCLHERQDTNWPPIDRRMIGRHATLFHDLHGVQLAQRIDAFQSMLTLKLSLPTCAASSTAVCTIAPHSPMGRNQCR